MKNLIAGAALLGSMLFAAVPAQALIITTSGQSGNIVDTSASTPGLLAADFDLFELGVTTLTVQLESGDVGSSLAFNSVVDNLTGTNFRYARLQLTGATFLPFDAARIVETTFAPSADAVVDAAASTISIRFNGAGEPNAFYLGNPFGSIDFDDLLIDLNGLVAGDSFQLQLAVPEPGSIGLLSLGALALGAVAMRKRRPAAA